MPFGLAGSNELRILIEATNNSIAAINATTAAVERMAAATATTTTATRAAAVANNGFNSSLHSTLSVTRGMFIRMIALAGVMAVFGAATKGTIGAAMDFEDSFTGIRKTMDATEEEFKQMEQTNRDLAKSMPVTVDEIN